MALAETVVILMRYAAIEEVNLNTEVQKPSLANALEFKGATMACAIESTPHEETCVYTSVLEGGNLMQKFKDDELQDMGDDGDEQGRQGYPIRATGIHATVQTPWPRDEEKEARDIAGATNRKPYSHRRQGNRWISMESRRLLLPQRHTSRVIMHIESRLGDHMSLPIEINGQLNPIDFKRPTEVMANGPDGLVTSDSHSRTTGVALLSGSRQPAMTALGRKYLTGKDRNGLPQLGTQL